MKAEKRLLAETGHSVEVLMRRAVEFPENWQPDEPRHEAVGRIFRVGQTTAIIICKAFEFDPFGKPIPL